jgi:hypothetical protein
VYRTPRRLAVHVLAAYPTKPAAGEDNRTAWHFVFVYARHSAVAAHNPFFGGTLFFGYGRAERSFRNFQIKV